MTYQLPLTEEKAVYVEQKFNEIAKHYDLFNDLITGGLHRCWKNFIVRQTGLRKGERCLDLCCGTGDIAQKLRKYFPETEIYALDFSHEMLQIAQERNQKTKTTIQFLRGDALSIPFFRSTFSCHYDGVWFA